MGELINKVNYNDSLATSADSYAAISNYINKTIIDNYDIWNAHTSRPLETINVAEPNVVAVDAEKEALKRKVEQLQKRINELEANQKEEVIW